MGGLEPYRPAAGCVVAAALALMPAIGCGPASGSASVHLERLLDGAEFTNDELPGVRPTVRSVRRDVFHMAALNIPAPGRLTFDVSVPAGAALDVALSPEGDSPITFRVHAGRGDALQTLLDVTYEGETVWNPHRVDLSEWEGRAVHLVLETLADRVGAEGLWGAPTIAGSARDERPNVILYVIDAAGSDYMSLYGYERATTPFLEELAREGVVFDRAFSNSSWTKISTPSFLTSLQSSVLGGYRDERDRIPDEVVTLPELLHDSGYLTAAFTSNPFAGSMTGLERGLDTLRDSGVAANSVSSVELHSNFRQWRDAFPVQPFWTHIQTTDVHWPWHPVEPYAGRYVSPEARQAFYGWERQLAAASGLGRPEWLHGWRYQTAAFEETGIDRHKLFSVAAGLYDETMLHNDEQLRSFVDDLKARGEWDDTLLIVGSDHGLAHGLGLLDEVPSRDGPIMGSARTRIPLLVVWPGRLAAGTRVAEPVSMLDVLPTVLELVGLPLPEVVQGRSFAPVLLSEPWNPPPVILDEVYVADDGTLSGWLEVVDGSWGASWRFESETLDSPVAVDEVRLCALDTDPQCIVNVAADHPGRVIELVAELRDRWRAHTLLAQQFSRAGSAEMTPEQIATLRALGYIQ